MKLFIASVIILFGVVFFLFALFPADMSVSRVVRINAPQDSVIRKIADLRTWKRWNDLTRKRADEKSANVIGEESDSTRLGNGRLTVHLLRQTPDSVITLWQDASGRSFVGKFMLSRSGQQVILQWNLEFHLRWYPWEKLASMFYEKQLGPLMEHSLLNLRKTLEPA